MKSANWISATGRRPFIAAPIDAPMIIDSVSGVSITRSSPNSPYSPSVARKTPPLRPTSSPITMTASSRRISDASVSRTASMKVLRAISAIADREGPNPAASVGRPFGGALVALVTFHAVPAAEAPRRRRLARPVLGENPLHRGRGIRVLGGFRVFGRLVDLDLDVGRDGGLDLLGEDAGVAQLLPKSWQRIRVAQRLELLGRAVLRLLIIG